MTDTHENPEDAIAATQAAAPGMVQIQQVGMALTHIATAAGKPDDAVMALTYAVAHTLGNYVDLDRPGAVDGILADTFGEVTRMYRIIVAKRLELQAQGAAQQ